MRFLQVFGIAAVVSSVLVSDAFAGAIKYNQVPGDMCWPGGRVPYVFKDDVVDESDLRRGRETANALFGNAASVLVGDFLYSRAFQMMVDVDDMRVMRVLSDATNIIAEGEVLQLMNCHDADVDEARYLPLNSLMGIGSIALMPSRWR